MKKLSLNTCVSVCALALASLSGSAIAAQCSIPDNVRVVIGSTSTGGDTYQNTSIVVRHLSKALGVDMKVDAVGAMPAFRALKRDSSGHTLMVFHDMAYLGNLYGVTGYADVFDEYKVGPTVSINPGNAYLVPKSSPYETAEDVIDAAGNGETIKVAIQPGGVSEIGFSALKNAVKMEYPGKEDNIEAVNTGSQADKNRLLFSGYADVINGSVQANEQYTRLPKDDQKAMRFIWLTARNQTLSQANEAGLGETTRKELMQYVTPNVSVPLNEKQDFTFDKEFFFIYNDEMDQKIVDCIDQTLADVYAKGDIQKDLKKLFYVPNFLPTPKAQKHLKDKMNKYKAVIANIS